VPARHLATIFNDSISDVCNVAQVTKAALPWLSVLLVFLVLITYIPAISLALPNFMGM
jgi:TRAP-type C4-dicarboxylate transport system permease large subunit